DTNSLIQNKLIIAHVLAHCDFFKNNVRFMNTRRDMVESMASTAERIANYETIHGKDKVEQFLDAALSIQEHIDPSLISSSRIPYDLNEGAGSERPEKTTPYDDLWDLDQRNNPVEEVEKKRRKLPP